MERRKRLDRESVDFLPTEHSAATNIFHYLEEESIIEFQDSNENQINDAAIVEAINLELLKELGKLALFVFRHEDDEKLGEGKGFNHIILNDGSIATLWVDDGWYLIPGNVSSQVKRQPFASDKLRHAHGTCSICPTLNTLRYNFGHSDFNNPQRPTPPLPETNEYAEAETEDDCMDCKESISEWLSARVEENSEYLWMFGGSGLHYDLPINETGYDFLDILNDDQPPTEFEVADSELQSIYSEAGNTEQDYSGGETGAELLLNQVLGIHMYSQFNFDDLILNCQCREPVKIDNELDIVLIDYDSQRMVIIETTTGRSRNHHLSQKQNAAVELKALSTYYHELEIEYIYLTTEEFPGGIERSSGTWILHQSIEHMEISFEVVTRPDDFDDSIVNTNGLITAPPDEVDQSISELYDHLTNELELKIEQFLG